MVLFFRFIDFLILENKGKISLTQTLWKKLQYFFLDEGKNPQEVFFKTDSVFFKSLPESKIIKAITVITVTSSIVAYFLPQWLLMEYGMGFNGEKG